MPSFTTLTFAEDMCTDGSLYCASSQSCIRKENVCDGVPDCPGNIDESVQCNKCPDNFCKNNGQCNSYESGANCTCPDGDNAGLYRCFGSVSGTAAPVKAPSSNKLVIAFSVFGSVLVVGVVLVVIYFILRKQRAEEAKLNQGLNNPVYDMQMGDLAGSEPFQDVGGQSSGSMENPLYGDNIDA